MPESSLAATWNELRQRVAHARGYSTDPDDWDDQTKQIVEFCIRSGARTFYKPRPVGGTPHEWSFLKPVFDPPLVLPAGEQDVPLPADFGFLMGNLYFLDSSLSYLKPIESRNVPKIQQLRQESAPTTGQPEFCAVASNTGPSATRGQRFTLMLWPTSNQEYTVTGRYSVLPDALDPSHPHPYGGAAHAETLIQACLAASEQLDKTPGAAVAHFAECLASSIEYDRRVAAQTIDNEDGRRRERDWYAGSSLPSTYNGQYS